MKKEESKFKYNRNKIPRNPGCYLFFDAKDVLLYVGKAKNLQKRVSSYFQKTKKSQKTEVMVKKIAKIETRIVNSEMEALILENNLVKEFMPKFNVLLRDDKNFLYLRVTKEDFPRIEITRRIVRDGSFYVGPKTSAKKFRKTINFCQKVFQIRTCRVGIKSKENDQVEITQNPERKKLPCMDYHIKKCSGPCDGLISREKYEEQVSLMKKFLRGKTGDVLKGLQSKMMELATEKKFEAAAKIRDLIKSIESSTERQRVQFDDEISRDFLSFYREKRHVYFVRVQFRQGRFIDQNEVKFSAESFLDDEEVWGQILLQFYDKVDEIPAKIFVPIEIENKEQLEKLLKVAIINPKKGDKKRVLEMAEKSAKNFAKKAEIESVAQEEIFAQALPRLGEKLGLESPPRRMECYDISHLSGTHTVASQVVFIDGRPKSSEYRRFKIKSLKSGEIDDFASMKEVLERRFRGISDEKREGEEVSVKVLDKDNNEEPFSFAKKNWAKYDGFEPQMPDGEFVWVVAKMGERIVGVFPGKKRSKTLWQVKYFIIDKNFRKKGIGRRMLECFESFLEKKSGKKLIVCADIKSCIFYEKYGFEKLSKYTKKQKESLKSLKEDGFECQFMEKKVSKQKTEIPRNPDLIVIDGGKGQLSAVLNALKDMPNIPLDIEKQVISLAKREEEVFRGKFVGKELVFEELSFDIDSAESKLLQRIRDEAHRFAISFNRNLREKSMKKSILDEIRGIGPKTKKELLQKFGSPSGIRSASDENLLEILNQKQLANLRKNL